MSHKGKVIISMFFVDMCIFFLLNIPCQNLGASNRPANMVIWRYTQFYIGPSKKVAMFPKSGKMIRKLLLLFFFFKVAINNQAVFHSGSLIVDIDFGLVLFFKRNHRIYFKSYNFHNCIELLLTYIYEYFMFITHKYCYFFDSSFPCHPVRR